MGAAVSASKAMLKDEYKDKAACQIAVGSDGAGIVADALNAKTTEGNIDTVSGIALMKCYGMSVSHIILYYVILVLIIGVCVLTIPTVIPDKFWKNCNICAEFKEADTNGNKQNCKKWRKGTPQECKNAGKIFEYVIGLVVGIVISGLISSIFMFYLRSKVYTTTGLIGNTAARLIF